MRDSKIPSSIAEKCKITMIIAGALIMGVLLFMAITIFIVDQEKLGMTTGLVTIVMAVFGIGPYLASFVVPKMFMSAAAAPLAACKSMSEKSERAAAVCQTAMIIQFGLIEGGVFANLIAFMLEASYISLIIATIGIALMLAFFPTPGRLTDRITALVMGR